MGNFSKLFGAILGGVVGLAGEAGISSQFATPEFLNAVSILLGSAFGTWIAPKNAS